MDAEMLWITLILLMTLCCHGNHDAKRLYDDLLRKNRYNKLIRPVGNSTSTLTVKLGIKLSQLVDVDEKNEIITTNVWVIQEWQDWSLRWNPAEYGGVNMLYVPSEDIWLPDIVLYNNADGDYTVTLMTKATLTYTGKVLWQPPAIYKSQCDINVRFFPFDEQECNLKFGSWSYDGFQVDIKHVWIEKYALGDTDVVENGIDVNEYYRSQEWDLMSVSAKKTIKKYPCCSEPYPDITFKIKIRRKTLFYAVNLIIPLVSIAFLTILTFHLPSDSGEKISLCISIFLSLTLFQLLLMELVPATSITTPLLGKYILFTVVIMTLSVFVSVMTLNLHFRSDSAHQMHGFMRKLFLNLLPRLLFMKRPEWKRDYPDEEEHDFELTDVEHEQHESTDHLHVRPRDSDIENSYIKYNITSTFIGSNTSLRNLDLSNFCQACKHKSERRKYPMQLLKALDGAVFVKTHLKDEDDGRLFKDDWRFVAMVIDRIFLYIYITVCVVGTMSLLMQPPMLYGHAQPLNTPN